MKFVGFVGFNRGKYKTNWWPKVTLAVTVFVVATVCDYRRTDSPYIWLKWSDSNSGKIRYENTKVRPDDVGAERKIKRRKHAIMGRIIAAEGAVGGEAWHLWVPQWLETKYSNRKSSLTKYQAQWRFLTRFLAENEIAAPRQFTRAHAFAYLNWRQMEVKEKSKRSPKLNTALADIRTLGRILREAIRHQYCEEDVISRLGVEKDDPEEKPELTDEQITLIRTALKKEAEWMKIAFEIAILSGLRHQDSQIRRKSVDFANGEITRPHPKGGRKRAFIHVGSDALLAFLKDVFSDGRQVTWMLPSGIFPGLKWRVFFDSIGLERPICFHCTRVTYISRGERAGVPEAVMCKQVNHASALIHRIYSRVPTLERRRFANAVTLPAPV